MPCTIKNPADLDLSVLEPHVQGMYDYFDQKIGFNRPPTMIFDSDPGNQSNVLGKTAYYDPSTLEIHVYSDGRHPKDMLRSIAHELIHHRQNLEGRLDVGGYHGEGYYLENEELKKLEHEAMLEGNAFMREYEDTLKRKENKEMSLNEWKNNELNKLLMKKFGILKEADDPETKAGRQGRGHGQSLEDFYKSIPGHGNDEEEEEENINEEKGAHDDGDGKDEKCDHVPCKDEANEGMDYKRDDELEEVDKNDGLSGAKGTSYGHMKEDSGEDEKDHYEDNEMSDEDHIKAIEHHLKALRKDRSYDDGHEAIEENNPAGSLANSKFGGDGMPEDELTEGQKINTLKESIKRVLKKNKKIKLRFKK